MGTKACINYNPVIGMRQHIYAIPGLLSEEITTLFLVPSLRNGEMINIVCRAWDRVGKKNMKERAKEEMKRGGYDEWLKERVSIVGLPFPEMDKQVEELEEQRVEELR